MRRLSVVILIVFTVMFVENVSAEWNQFDPAKKIYEGTILKKMMGNSIPINTQKIITLKNIALSGDVKNTLINSCIKKNTDALQCTFDDTGKINLGNFTYGNLGGERHSEPNAYVSEGGELLAYYHRDSDAPDKFVKLSELLTEKYGKPLLIEGQLLSSDKMCQYDRQQMYWKDANGTVMAIDTIFNCIHFTNPPSLRNLGIFSIMSKSSIEKMNNSIAESSKELKKESERKLKEYKNNL